MADRCTVLRKGKYIATVPVKTTSVEEMAEMMVGRKISFSLEKEDITPGKTVLNVQNLVVKGAHNKNAVDDVSFEVREGEIVCIAGIDGNGQSEIAYALSGLKEIDSAASL